MREKENKDQLDGRQLVIPRTLPLNPSLLKSLVKCTYKSQNVHYQTCRETGEAAGPSSRTNTAQRHADEDPEEVCTGPRRTHGFSLTKL